MKVTSQPLALCLGKNSKFPVIFLNQMKKEGVSK